MSNPKITAKNLTYNTTLPPFLARLQASNSSAALDGRHERPLARPRLKRDSDAGIEDEPAYVDEATNETLDRDAVGKLLGSIDAKDDQGIRSNRDDATDDEGNVHCPDDKGEVTDRFGRRVRSDGSNEGSKLADTEMKPVKHIDSSPTHEKLAVIGASRKRKVVRAIGTNEEADIAAAEQDEVGREANRSGSTKGGGLEILTGERGGKLKVKKGKKVKLSFSDGES